MSTPDIILKLSNIESYYGPITAIRGISLEVLRGQIVTLLGANGAGKTTVLKTISGILDPQKGTIEFRGKPIQPKEPPRPARRAAFRRRAADAGDRARLDDPADLAFARRAVARPVADPGQGD